MARYNKPFCTVMRYLPDFLLWLQLLFFSNQPTQASKTFLVECTASLLLLCLLTVYLTDRLNIGLCIPSQSNK